jgi:hypothetical protein
MHTEFWLRYLKGIDHSQNLSVDGRIILKLILKKQDEKWTGLIWLRIGTSGGLLWTR